MDHSLYREIILKHNQDSFHFYSLDNYDLKVKTENESCSDSFDIYLKLSDKNPSGESEIVDISFEGQGCAVSKAVTSIFIQKIYGSSVLQAILMCNLYLGSFGEPKDQENLSSELSVFNILKDHPARKKCATFSVEQLLCELQKLK